MNKNYSDLSINLTKELNKKQKKDNGIFFTPINTINIILKYIQKYNKNIKEVLEPSCGSCEFILQLNKKYKNIIITGIEYNNIIYNNIKNIESKNITIYNSNFLEHKFDKKFNLIIGNPPYYVMKKKDVDKKYYNFFDGRPNIFILFIIKSLELLEKDGIISFILPKNFLNCSYYDKTRKYINNKYNILNIIKCNDNYIETKQETINIFIENKSPLNNNLFSIKLNDEYTLFETKDNIIKIKKLYEKSTTLNKLGFSVNVGNIVWNQNKDILTNNKKKTLLIYSSDIKNGKLEIQEYSNKQKKNYIDKPGNTGPLLVINRGYGKGKYKFNYCIINEKSTKKYLIENHLICIKYNKTINNMELIKKYKKIINSFENKKTNEFIDIYFSNNSINTNELANLLPIYGF